MNHLAAVSLLAMAGLMSAHSPNADTFKSVYAARDVALETDPHSQFWRGASPVYIEADVNGKPVPGHRTEVRSRWTKDNLYLLYVCPYEELHLKPSPDTVGETNQLWNWDVAELFIGTDFQNISRYKEF